MNRTHSLEVSMETSNDGITYHDTNGVEITLGAVVEGGGYGRDGKIVGFSAPDENWGGVWVKWPEHAEPEFQSASGSPDEIHTCEEVEIAVCQGHMTDGDGDFPHAAIGDTFYCDGKCRG